MSRFTRGMAAAGLEAHGTTNNTGDDDLPARPTVEAYMASTEAADAWNVAELDTDVGPPPLEQLKGHAYAFLRPLFTGLTEKTAKDAARFFTRIWLAYDAKRMSTLRFVAYPRPPTIVETDAMVWTVPVHAPLHHLVHEADELTLLFHDAYVEHLSERKGEASVAAETADFADIMRHVRRAAAKLPAAYLESQEPFIVFLASDTTAAQLYLLLDQEGASASDPEEESSSSDSDSASASANDADDEAVDPSVLAEAFREIDSMEQEQEQKGEDGFEHIDLDPSDQDEKGNS